MERLIKASLEESKTGLGSLHTNYDAKKIVVEIPKFADSIKSMSQIERDYKQVKASNILDREYSDWYSYKK